MNFGPNALKEWLDFYNANAPKAPSYGPSMFGGKMPADQGEGLNWAVRMMQGQASQSPDFFGGESGGGFQPSYSRPERFQGEMPQQQSFQSRLRPQIENRLAMLLKGR